jgi:hypothetical protein
MIIRCHVCQSDPAGRWHKPPAMVFTDPSPDDDHRHACRDHLSAKKKEQVEAREKSLSLPIGGLR